MERNLKVRELLEDKKVNSDSELTINVIEMILQTDDCISHMEDVVNYGCSSGIVGDLVYIDDCKEFISKHLDEIFTMYNELDSQFSLDISELAWFAYEHICIKLLADIDCELEELE